MLQKIKYILSLLLTTLMVIKTAHADVFDYQNVVSLAQKMSFSPFETKKPEFEQANSERKEPEFYL